MDQNDIARHDRLTNDRLNDRIPDDEPDTPRNDTLVAIVFDEDWVRDCAEGYDVNGDAAIERVRAAEQGLHDQISKAAVELIVPILLGN